MTRDMRDQLLARLRRARSLAESSREDTLRRARARRPPDVASDPGLAVVAQLARSVEELAEAVERLVESFPTSD